MHYPNTYTHAPTPNWGSAHLPMRPLAHPYFFYIRIPIDTYSHSIHLFNCIFTFAQALPAQWYFPHYISTIWVPQRTPACALGVCLLRGSLVYPHIVFAHLSILHRFIYRPLELHICSHLYTWASVPLRPDEYIWRKQDIITSQSVI